MNLKRIIKEEINDFDWAKEINPIQCKDLKGYYFYHGEVKNNDPFIRKFVIEDVFIKNPRGYGRGDDLDSLKIYYTWRDRTTYDWNQMECDTFIHRVKTGDYTLYDKNGVKVNPRDLAYTDGTFDDDERKEIWEQKELIKESGVENYLQSIASMTSGNQKKYYQWILDNLEKVPVVSYRSNEELEEKIDRFVKKMRRFGDFCQKKGCFDTAYNTAMYVPGVHYIEGYVQAMIPIVHAWNYLPEENIYFDLINDIAWDGEDSHFNDYYKVIDLDKSGVLKWSSTTGYGGGFLESPQFINSILK